MFWKRKRKGITAAKLAKKLERDPDFVARRDRRLAERAQATAENLAIQARILEDLRHIGIRAESLAELPELGSIPPEAVRLLVGWLGRTDRPDVRMGIVQALGAAAEPFDGAPLAALFDQTHDWLRQWTIANTISCCHPTGICDWLVARLGDSSLGRAREMLAVAAGEMLAPERANAVLRAVFDELPGHCALGLAHSGGQGELEFLQSRRGSHQGWVRNEIDRAISAIQKRIRRGR